MAKTHGHAGRRHLGKWVEFPSPTYVSWEGMKRRVTPVHSEHKHYAGIKVCERWKSFENFLADMGERPEGMTLDRIDVNGDYCPENCRWATWSQQNKNRKPFRRSDNVYITHHGTTRTAPEWERELGLSSKLIRNRLRHGMSPARALSTNKLNKASRQVSD